MLSEPGSKDRFALGCKDLAMGRKEQYRWTMLPQGLTVPLNFFGQVLEQFFEQFQPWEEVFLLQCGDDLLLSGREKTAVKEATNKLFDFLGKQGLKVLENQ